jgi:hypothetical protein
MKKYLFAASLTVLALVVTPVLAQADKSTTPPTKFDASGMIKCSTTKPTLDQQCEFRVARHLASGSAQIWVAPVGDAPARVLHYTNKQFTGTDGAALSASRQDDNWQVGAGGKAFYLIPDALISGG